MSAIDTQERLDWLEWRRNGLGASDIAGVLGLSPWSTPWSVWWSKVGPAVELEGSEAMEFGRRSEPMLAEWLEDKTGLSVDGAQTRIEHGRDTWKRCTVDGFAYDGAVRDPSVAVAVVEYKTTSDPPEAWSPEVPLHYACQATWTSIVTGHPVVLFGVLHIAFGRPTFRVYTFQPTSDDIRLVTRMASEFWTEHVLAAVPPPVDGEPATTDALSAAFHADPELEPLEADPSLAVVIERIAANEERIKACQRVVDEQKNILREVMGDHAVLTLGTDDKGKPRVIATWRDEHRSGYVVEESSSRVLRVKTKGKR